MDPEPDAAVSLMVEQWEREMPGIDATAMALFGRLSRVHSAASRGEVVAPHHAGHEERRADVRVGEPLRVQPRPARVRAGARVKVGFLSAFFRESTAGRYFEHWVTDLPRE